jgi:predicted ester cyclase
MGLFYPRQERMWADLFSFQSPTHRSLPIILRTERGAHPLPKECKMSSKVDLYKAYYKAAWSNPPSSNIEAAKTYLSDDFQSLDKEGNVLMNKEAYLGMVQLLFAAFKDFTYVRGDVREEGDSVIVNGHFEGTHTGDFDMSAMGMGVIPASGKKIVWPEASNEFNIEGDKVVSIKPYGDSGGTEAFLSALGVKAPSA